MANNNVLKVDVSRAESDKTLKKDIEKKICALFNSNGGKLIVTASDDADKIDVDNKIRRCEQYFQGVIGTNDVQQYFKISEESDRVILDISDLPRLCTLSTNLFMSTNTETPLLPPIEQDVLRKILFESRVVEIPKQEVPDQFCFGHKLDIIKSKTVRFKKPGTQTDKDFTHYISGFANGSGGMILYGINDDRTVVGELLSDEEKNRQEITEKLEKAVRTMKWPEISGEIERGKQWDIKFVPVKNCEENEKRFVIVISVSPCSGGVFTKEPESYYVEDGVIKKMSFETWKEKAGQLGGWKKIEANFKEILEETKDITTKLVCLLQIVAVNYHQGEFEIAQNNLERFREMIAERNPLEYQPSHGDYPRPSVIIKDGSLKSDNGPAGLILRSYYDHAASVLKELESPNGKNKDDTDFEGKEQEQQKHVERAKYLCDEALQDLMKFNNDCELGQRINIMLALLYLKSASEDLASNSEITTAEVKIKESEECIKNLDQNGSPFINNLHQLLLAKSKLHSEIAERCVKKTAKLANANAFEEIKLQCKLLESQLKTDVKANEDKSNENMEQD